MKKLWFVSENWARRWMALWLLPLVWMSVAAGVPHDHHLRDLSARIGITSTCSASNASISAPAPLALLDNCLLCDWASVATAWLLIALIVCAAACAPAIFASALWRAIASGERLPNCRAPPRIGIFADTS